MARSRRSYRRTTSQRALSLLALALPAPIQRVAETKFGSSLLILGIPLLIIVGVLHLNWEGGMPHFTLDRDRAAQIKNAARDELGRLSDPNTIQQWENSAKDFWNTGQMNGQAPYSVQPNAYGTSYPPPATQAYHQFDRTVPTQSPPIPSSSAARYASTQSSSSGTTSLNGYSNSPSYNSQPPTQPSYYQQPTYQQPTYQQPTYQQPSYQQPVPPTQFPQSYQQSYQQPTAGQWRQ